VPPGAKIRNAAHARPCPLVVWLFEFEFDLEFLTDRFACFNPFTVLDIVTTVK